MISPILKEIKSSLKDDFKILKIDVNKNQKVATAYQVRGVPTLIIFQKDKIVWRQSGVIPAHELISRIKSLAS